jgi:segregation and condensation protein B
MSLKSKIEAVIYASEEPVTLVQLIGLLSEEAQAELDAIAAQQAQLALDGAPFDAEPAEGPVAAEAVAPESSDEEPAHAPDADALNAEVLEVSEEADAAEAPEAAAEGDGPADPAGDADATEDAAEEAVVEEIVEEDAATATEAEGEAVREGETGDAESAEAEVEPEEATEAGVEAGVEAAEVEAAEVEAGDEAEPEEAEASHAAPAAQVELRQPTPEEDEASAKAWARAKERELRNYLRSLVEQLIAEYANSDRGIEIKEVAGGFRFSTKPEYHDAVRGFIKSLKPPMKLSLQALETLAVVAYKQPITAPEISEIRGVDSGGVVGSLIARKLVTTAGRKQVIGRPILYKTTKDFLVRFGLKDINELPSIEEFEKMAGELADLEPTQEEIPMDVVEEAAAEREAAENAEPMADEHEAQADGVPDAESSDRPSVVEAPDVDADVKPEEHSEEPVEGADEPDEEETPVDADEKPEQHSEEPAEGAGDEPKDGE